MIRQTTGRARRPPDIPPQKPYHLFRRNAPKPSLCKAVAEAANRLVESRYPSSIRLTDDNSKRKTDIHPRNTCDGCPFSRIPATHAQFLHDSDTTCIHNLLLAYRVRTAWATLRPRPQPRILLDQRKSAFRKTALLAFKGCFPHPHMDERAKAVQQPGGVSETFLLAA